MKLRINHLGRIILKAIFFIAIYFLLRHPFEEFLTKFFISPFLSEWKTSPLTDACFIIILLYISGKFLFSHRRRKPSPEITIFLFSVAVIISAYRFRWVEEGPWIFPNSYYIPSLKYIDIFFLFLLRLPFHLNRGKPDVVAEPSLIEDKPITSPDEDILNYRNHAGTVARAIQDQKSDNSIAIGIQGEWGFGKTSFLNLIKSGLKDDRIITFDFKPWASSSHDAIIRDFFENFQEAVKPYHFTLDQLLHQYSHKLVHLNPNTLISFIQALITLNVGDSSIHRLYEKISGHLRKIDRKIIVFIDDLDRLDSHEVMEVLRIIRNTANFPNTIFVVTYERQYLVHAAEKSNVVNAQNYLEKIFQVEITLPYFSREKLWNKLISNLEERWPDLDFRMKVKNIHIPHSRRDLFRIGAEEWLRSVRDVSRLSNSMFINYSRLQGEVRFEDFFKLELLRLRYPIVYELLYREKDRILRSDKGSYIKHEYRLMLDEPESSNKYNNTRLFYILQENKQLNFSEHQLMEVVLFVDSLFHSILKTGSHHHDPISVKYPSKFERYFAYELLEGSLSEVQFSVARNNSLEEFKVSIEKWIKEGYKSELYKKFIEIRSFDDREDFEKIIRSIVHFAKLSGNFSVDSFSWGYDLDDLAYKLSDREDTLSHHFYNDSKEGLIMFIKSIFENGSSPSCFEAKFAHKLLTDSYTQLAITHDELRDYIFNFVLDGLKECEKWNDQLLFLISRTGKDSENERGEKRAYVSVLRDSQKDEIREGLRNFILGKDVKGFLKGTLHSTTSMKGSIHYYIPIVLLSVFDGWDDYQSFLAQIKLETDHEMLKEYSEFLEDFIQHNGSSIPYSFSKNGFF